MQEGKIIETVGELVLGKIVDKVNEYKSKKEWSQLFVNTGEFFLKHIDGGERFIEEMSALLSSENMKELAKKSDEGSKYLLKYTLHRELKKLMLRYEIPAQEAESYISNFILVIMCELEKVNPALFQCAYLGDWRESEKRQLDDIRKEIELVNRQLKEFQSKRVEVYSLDQIEIELAKQTVNPSLDLDFFEIDDEIFRETFEEYINDECIYVSGQCKEETIYCLLNELRRLNIGRVVFVVKKEEDWQNLRLANEEKPELGDKILIPWFNAEQIYAIPNNTNIFVYGKEEYCCGKNVINMRKRKRSTIVHKLKDAGLDYEDAYDKVKDTHGLYIPLKKKLINGKYNIVPNWVNGEEDLLIPLLLCGQWTETEGDQVVLEDLCGRNYDQIVEDIRPYMKGEDPLFIKFKMYGKVVYHLASVENAWDYLDDKVVIDDKKWNRYVNCVLEIISEPDPMFNFTEAQQSYAESLPGGKSFWSSTLKEGLLRSFIMKAYYKKNIKSQNAIDEVVRKILAQIKSLNQWLSIAEYFSILCEASPKAVMQRLDDEWENATGLVEVFSKEEDNGLFSKNYYTHFIWGIEQFLLQKECVAWAVRWFLKMNNLGIRYAINNSPKETLKQIFCTWINVTVLSQEDKIYLIKEAFENGYDIWDLIYDELPGRNMHMVGAPSKPKYRMVEDTSRVTKRNMWLANKEYLLLCLSNMEFDSKRWIKMVEVADHFEEEYISIIFRKLEYELRYMSDIEIISIKNTIRKEIYRHRYFCNSEWAIDEELILKYESELASIKTKNLVYEYAYMFENSYDFPLLHPCPYSEDENHEINEQLAKKEIENSLRQFKDEGFDICELISICSEYEYSTLGMYVFEFYCNKTFDKELIVRMMKYKSSKHVVVDYVRAAYIDNYENLVQAVNIAKELEVDEDILIDLLLIEQIDARRTPLISNEDDTIKQKYWGYGHNYVDDEKTCRYMITESLKYSNRTTFIETLDRCKKHLMPEEILLMMEKMANIDSGVPTQLTSFHIKNILKILQKEYLTTEYCTRVAILELTHRGLLEWGDMKCFKHCLELSPKFLADMVSIIYKKDDGAIAEDKQIDEKVISSIYSLFYRVEFCPAELNGKVDRENLFNWIESFKEMLKQQKQERLFTHFLGRIFAYSPIGEDGYYPYESIREAIQKYGDEKLENQYVISIFNQRGVFSPTGGDAERKLANRYKKNADAVRTKYSKVANIYDKLCDRYLYDADLERECEEYADI